MVLGFGIVPVRALLLAVTDDPMLMVSIQALDGLAAACFGVMVPLVTSDIAGRTGHFNLSLGVVGFAIGVGATLSTTAAGWTSDQFGDPTAFLMLAFAGLMACLLVAAGMPETKPSESKSSEKEQ